MDDAAIELLQRHPTLVGELSYRTGPADPSGHVALKWRALFIEFPNRFVIGSDTWINARRADDQGLMRAARPWLGDLPPGVAQRIAWGNAPETFGLAEPK